MRFTKRDFLVVSTLVVLLGSVALWHFALGRSRLERQVRERLFAMVDASSIPGHALRMDSIEVDLVAGRLVVTGLRFDVEPHLLESLELGGLDHLITATADRADLRGVSYMRLLLSRELRMEAFQLSGLRFTHWVGGGRQADGPSPAAPEPLRPSGLVQLLHADTVLVDDASVRVEDVSDALPDMDISGFSMLATGFTIRRGKLRSGVDLALDEGHLALDTAFARLANGGHLSTGAVGLDWRTGRGVLQALRWVSDATDTAAKGLSLAADSLVVTRLDVRRLVADEGLSIGRLAVHGLHLDARLDKTMALADTNRHPLPPEALLSWEFPLAMDTVLLDDASILYRERSSRTDRWGEVPFRAVRVLALGIANGAGAPPLQVSFRGTLFDSASVTMDYRARLDGTAAFVADVSVGAMPLPQLNRALRPLTRAEIRAGRLDGLQMRLEGDDHRARGKVSMAYHGLLLGPEPGVPPELAHRQLAGIMAYLTEERHGGGLSGDRTRTVRVERDSTKALPHYLWQGLRKGLFRDVGADSWQRMRDVVRDGRQRR